MGLSKQILCALPLAAIVMGVTGAAQTDTLRVSSRLVEVSVTVRDKNGPVADLKQSDFTLLDNGKPQRIDVFSVVNAQKPIPASAPTSTAIISNRTNSEGETPGAGTVILFDMMNSANEGQVNAGTFGGNANFGNSTNALEDQGYAIKELIKYLRNIRGDERVALYILGSELYVVQDFTGDPDKLVRAAARLKALDAQGVEVQSVEALVDLLEPPPVSTEAGAEPVYLHSGLLMATGMSVTSAIVRATATADSLEAIARRLKGLPGRKNLVWMSAGFPFVPPTPPRTPGDARARPVETPDNFASQLNRASRALNGANVALYPVDIQGLRGGYPEVMLRLADATGGRVSYHRNDLAEAVRTAADDSEVSYLLGFYSTAKDSDRSFHSLTVKVAHKDSDVRHRVGYYPSDNQKLNEQQRQALLGELIASPLNASEIGLTAEASPDPTIPGNYRITIVADAKSVLFEQRGDRRAATLILASRLESSKAKTAKTATIPLSLSEKEFQSMLKRGIVLTSSMQAAAHDRLRIVIQDQVTGLAGSLLLQLESRNP